MCAGRDCYLENLPPLKPICQYYTVQICEILTNFGVIFISSQIFWQEPWLINLYALGSTLTVVVVKL